MQIFLIFEIFVKICLSLYIFNAKHFLKSFLKLKMNIYNIYVL